MKKIIIFALIFLSPSIFAGDAKHLNEFEDLVVFLNKNNWENRGPSTTETKEIVSKPYPSLLLAEKAYKRFRLQVQHHGIKSPKDTPDDFVESRKDPGSYRIRLFLPEKDELITSIQTFNERMAQKLENLKSNRELNEKLYRLQGLMTHISSHFSEENSQKAIKLLVRKVPALESMFCANRVYRIMPNPGNVDFVMTVIYLGAMQRIIPQHEPAHQVFSYAEIEKMSAGDAEALNEFEKNALVFGKNRNDWVDYSSPTEPTKPLPTFSKPYESRELAEFAFDNFRRQVQHYGIKTPTKEKTDFAEMWLTDGYYRIILSPEKKDGLISSILAVNERIAQKLKNEQSNPELVKELNQVEMLLKGISTKTANQDLYKLLLSKIPALESTLLTEASYNIMPNPGNVDFVVTTIPQDVPYASPSFEPMQSVLLPEEVKKIIDILTSRKRLI